MKQVGPPVTLVQIEKKSPNVNSWFDIIGDRMNVYHGTANPTALQVPAGQWVMYKNTTLGEVRFWTNDNGTMKSVLLS